MKFFKLESDYLSKPNINLCFWGSLIGGVVSLTASVLLYQTRWALPTAALGVFYLVDACLLRYAYELRRTIMRSGKPLN